MSELNIEQKIAALREGYAGQLPDKLARIDALWQTVCGSDDAMDALSSMHFLVHGLTGSGATFGFAALSQTARLLEIFLKSLVQDKTMPTAEQRQQIGALLDKLREDAAHPPSIEAATAMPDAPAEGQTTRLIYLVDDDHDVARSLVIQLSNFGYDVKHFDRPERMLATLREQAPCAIIMDIVFPEGFFAGTEAIAGMVREIGAKVPVVFISGRSDQAARLSAVRAGGKAYFTKPVDIGALVDKLDSLTLAGEQEPYRVMVVEDSPPLCAFYAFTLQQAGMIVETVTEPLRVLEKLDEFKPELIIMDMYMPEISGMELAQLIRQEESFVSIPIVFLSAEQDLDKQFAALDIGVDDFLTKPIEPAHLVLSARSRVQRYRVLRSFMVRDSLTGLFNHTNTKQQLEIEFSRAVRHNRPLAFVMLDLDHFKVVNDTYGHATGDRVIKSLARLLRQRLRHSDIVGRLGGEEFAVILTETDAETAIGLMNEIRAAFQSIRQRSEKDEFSITFSCGIATIPPAASTVELGNAADMALYEAKRGGRNRVVLAEQAYYSKHGA